MPLRRVGPYGGGGPPVGGDGALRATLADAARLESCQKSETARPDPGVDAGLRV